MSSGEQVAVSTSPTRPIPFARTVISAEARAAADRVLASGWVTTGRETELFEQEFAAWTGADQAVAVSSCTAAIELSLRALHLPLGAPVLVSTMTFCGAVHAIVHAGLRPVLVDIDEKTGMPSPDTTRRAAAECGGARAMLVVHLGGHPADVRALADAAGLTLSSVVEDAAHALGGWIGNDRVGQVSHATCFSFYATKNLPIGEGGMITTADPELAAWVRRGRLHGMSTDAWRRYLPGGSWRYSVEQDGLKANLTDLQSAIGREQLRHLGDWQRRRSQIARRYRERLADLPGLALPSCPRYGRHAWHLFAVRVQPEFGLSRDELVGQLSAQRIGTSVHFIPVHHLPYFRGVVQLPVGGLPVADAVFRQLVSLPLDQGLHDEDVERICDAVSAASRLYQPVEVAS
jgi:dTDP-4-amino-4,6-dideoxygalactose transaminase